MEHLKKEDLEDIVRILADFRDRRYIQAQGNKADGIKARNLAWAKNAERLIGLVTAEMENENV